MAHSLPDLPYAYDALEPVIDARTMDSQPVARVRIPARVPYGFHCTWIPAS